MDLSLSLSKEGWKNISFVACWLGSCKEEAEKYSISSEKKWKGNNTVICI